MPWEAIGWKMDNIQLAHAAIVLRAGTSRGPNRPGPWLD